MENSYSAHLFHMKSNDHDHWGPYGMLVREVAFCLAEVGNHDYLDIPEIVEDIALCFAEQYEFDLRSAFIENSKPCIVKFIDQNPHEWCLTPALYYLYTKFRGESLSRWCNTCFDGQGKPVRPDQIKLIENTD